MLPYGHKKQYNPFQSFVVFFPVVPYISHIYLENVQEGTH